MSLTSNHETDTKQLEVPIDHVGFEIDGQSARLLQPGTYRTCTESFAVQLGHTDKQVRDREAKFGPAVPRTTIRYRLDSLRLLLLAQAELREGRSAWPFLMVLSEATVQYLAHDCLVHAWEAVVEMPVASPQELFQHGLAHFDALDPVFRQAFVDCASRALKKELDRLHPGVYTQAMIVIAPRLTLEH